MYMQNLYSGHLVFLRFYLLLSMAGRAPTPTAGATCETWMNWRLPDESLVKISFERNPFTPLRTNMSPENQRLEDVFPTENSPFFRGHVSFQGCKYPRHPKISPEVFSGMFFRVQNNLSGGVWMCRGTHILLILHILFCYWYYYYFRVEWTSFFSKRALCSSKIQWDLTNGPVSKLRSSY